MIDGTENNKKLKNKREFFWSSRFLFVYLHKH
uniref:Uncharacterized protein n=1 Tax=Myoviridae sp. ctNQV2 TaxID=2827683 RepID=A0A8S5S050_9CAUD|nr:MAG TPA: hypothetical protein [Myoviridae sp. ctNQV2]